MEKPKKFKSLFARVIWWLNVLLAFGLLLSILSPYIAPSYSRNIAIIGLLFPLFYAIQIPFILYWIYQKKKRFLLSLVMLVLGILNAQKGFQFFASTAPSKGDSLKVISFNVKVFDLYDWNNDDQTKDKIIAFIEHENPDVVCFQEYYRGENIHFDVREVLKSEAGLNYFSEKISVKRFYKKYNAYGHFGSAIFSKYPIIKTGSYDFKNDKSNHIAWVDILKNEDTLRVFNAHLGSIRLQNKDYQLIGGDDNKKWPFEKAEPQDFIARVKNAYIKREAQVGTLKKLIEYSIHPAILCIDLNDVPNSYAYKQITLSLKDPFTTFGCGFGSTYIGDNFFNRILPVNRIDYILHSESLSAMNFVTYDISLSDHRPIGAEITW